jgi:hypothetical protein
MAQQEEKGAPVTKSWGGIGVRGTKGWYWKKKEEQEFRTLVSFLFL